MIGKLKEFLRLSGGEWLVSFTTREDPGKLFDTIQDAETDIKIRKYSQKRSLDANAFCWALCTDIGKAITPPIAKEDVYRKAIRAVGVYTPVDVSIWKVNIIRERWSSHGEGWFVDVMDDAGIGKNRIHLYYGTSTYTAEEMRILLDWLVDEAEQMGIVPRLSKDEEERILAQWEKASSRKTEGVSSAAV